MKPLSMLLFNNRYELVLTGEKLEVIPRMKGKRSNNPYPIHHTGYSLLEFPSAKPKWYNVETLKTMVIDYHEGIDKKALISEELEKEKYLILDYNWCFEGEPFDSFEEANKKAEEEASTEGYKVVVKIMSEYSRNITVQRKLYQ